VIQSPDGSTVRIFPASRVIYNEQSRDIQDWLHLFFGSIKVHIEKLSGRPNPHNMTTPTAVIAVRGTTFSVFVDETNSTLVAVDEGVVAVANRRSRTDEILLQRGERTWVRGDQPPLRAQAFRGRSDRADLIPWRSGASQNAARNGMGDRSGDHTASGMTGSPGSMAGGMTSRPGPPH
jgi:ferric-dicitrate binding protein FerR (iron transport regulator)